MCIKNKSGSAEQCQLSPGKHTSYKTFIKQTLGEICYPQNVPEVLFGLIV
jgi:hypothetical protein